MEFWRWLIRYRRVYWSVLGTAVCACIVLASGLLVEFYTYDESLGDPQSTHGTLLICGGGRLPNTVRDRFFRLAGGKDARIVVIPAELTSPEDHAEIKELGRWASRGQAKVDVLYTTDRARSDDPDFIRPLAEATGVWIGGGEQDWLTRMYVGTAVEKELHLLLERGGVIAGSSAGAAVMSGVMISRGHRSAIEGRGFGLFPGAVVDQHFLKRNRVTRLLGILSTHSDLVGFGVDEGTALEVWTETMQMRVIGNSYVMACIPNPGGHTARIEILQSGDHTDLARLQEPDVPLATAEDLDDATDMASDNGEV